MVARYAKSYWEAGGKHTIRVANVFTSVCLLQRMQEIPLTAFALVADDGHSEDDKSYF